MQRHHVVTPALVVFGALALWLLCGLLLGAVLGRIIAWGDPGGAHGSGPETLESLFDDLEMVDPLAP